MDTQQMTEIVEAYKAINKGIRGAEDEASMHTLYHSRILEHKERRMRVRKVVQMLENFDPDVALVFTGLSGILVGMFVADQTGRPFAILRKDGESHHGLSIEGYRDITKYVIIDDFIVTGKTIDRIIAYMPTATEKCGVTCVGIILHDKDKCWSEENVNHKSGDSLIPVYVCS